MHKIRMISIAALITMTLLGCTSQTMSTQVQFQDVGSIPPPRNGPVYVGLKGQATELTDAINSSAHLTTLPPSANSTPVFYINAEQQFYARSEDDFIWIPAFLAMIIPASGVQSIEWQIDLQSSSDKYPSRSTYLFKRRWYLSFFPHVYLFGKYAKFGESSQITPDAIVKSEKAHVVSNIIYEANRKGFLNINK